MINYFSFCHVFSQTMFNCFIILGFILMSGGGSDDPTIFNPEIYNFRRIRLAPTLVLIGLGIEVYAILLNPHKKKN